MNKRILLEWAIVLTAGVAHGTALGQPNATAPGSTSHLSTAATYRPSMAFSAQTSRSSNSPAAARPGPPTPPATPGLTRDFNRLAAKPAGAGATGNASKSTGGAPPPVLTPRPNKPAPPQGPRR